MFNFGQLEETGKAVVEFIQHARAAIDRINAEVIELRRELSEHRIDAKTAHERIERIEQSHHEIMDWIAEIEGSEATEAAAVAQIAAVEAGAAAAIATSQAEQATAAVEAAPAVAEESMEEVPASEIAELPIETPIPEQPAEESPKRRRLVSL